MQSLQASPMNVPRGAVFLDRDGVLIRDTDYVRTLAEVGLIPGAAAAVRALNDTGFVVVVVTNQSGVARGIFDESLVHQVHELIVNRIQQEVAKSLATPVMKEKLLAQGAIPSGNTPAQFAQLIDSELKKWQPVVKASGAKVD